MDKEELTSSSGIFRNLSRFDTAVSDVPFVACTVNVEAFFHARLFVGLEPIDVSRGTILDEIYAPLRLGLRPLRDALSPYVSHPRHPFCDAFSAVSPRPVPFHTASHGPSPHPLRRLSDFSDSCDRVPAHEHVDPICVSVFRHPYQASETALFPCVGSCLHVSLR